MNKLLLSTVILFLVVGCGKAKTIRVGDRPAGPELPGDGPESSPTPLPTVNITPPPTPLPTPTSTPNPTPTSTPSPLACQLARVLPIQSGEPMLFVLTANAPVTQALINSQPAQVGQAFPVLPLNGLYIAQAVVSNPTGSTTCSITVAVPGCSLHATSVTPAEVRMELNYTGPVTQAKLGTQNIALPSPPANQTTFVRPITEPAGLQNLEVEVRSLAGDFAKCRTEFVVPSARLDIQSATCPPLPQSGPVGGCYSDPERAFDGDPSTMWTGVRPGFGGADGLVFDLGEVTPLSKVKVMPWQSLPGAATYEVSAGLTQSQLSVVGTFTTNGDGVMVQSSFRRRDARYFKVRATQTPIGDSGADYAGFREVEAYY